MRFLVDADLPRSVVHLLHAPCLLHPRNGRVVGLELFRSMFESRGKGRYWHDTQVIIGD